MNYPLTTNNEIDILLKKSKKVNPFHLIVAISFLYLLVFYLFLFVPFSLSLLKSNYFLFNLFILSIGFIIGLNKIMKDNKNNNLKIKNICELQEIAI